MTALVIRDAFRAALTNFIATVRPDAAFYDSISERVDPAPPLWVTVSFFPVDSVPLSCAQALHSGTAEINVYGEGGVGDADVIALAEDIEAQFNNNPGLANGVSISRVAQPVEATSGDGVAWYGVTVAADYLAKL